MKSYRIKVSCTPFFIKMKVQHKGLFLWRTEKKVNVNNGYQELVNNEINKLVNDLNLQEKDLHFIL